MAWSNDWQDGENQFRVQLDQVQIPDSFMGSEPYRVPVDLWLRSVDFDTVVTVMSDQLEQEFVIPLPAEITLVQMDPDRWLLYRMAEEESPPATKDVVKAPVRLLPAYPNPFNPRCLFRWETSLDTRDLIEIFDVQGRRILSVQKETAGPGPRDFIWTGIDTQGRQAPSGTYLYRITCRGQGPASGQGESTWQLQGKVTLAR
jgi:hypothetical protein